MKNIFKIFSRIRRSLDNFKKYLLKKTEDRNFQILVLSFVIFCVLANIFAYYFTNQEHTVYYWDLITFWTRYLTLGELIRVSLNNAFQYFIYDISHNDYNSFAVFFLEPFYFLIGGGRTAFIASVVNVLALPSALLIWILTSKVVKIVFKNVDISVLLLSLLTIFLLPQFWSASLYGYIGVMGTGVIAAILLCYLATLKKPATKSVFLYITIGILSTILIIIRRWFIYWTLSFYLLIFLLSFYKYLKSKRKKEGILLLRNIIFSAILSSALFLVCCGPVAKESLTTNFSIIYAAYGSHNAMTTFLKLVDMFGYFNSAIFVAGAVLAFLYKKNTKIIVLLGVQIVGIYLLFTSVQDFESNQIYLLLPSLFVFEAFFLAFLRKRFLKTKYKWSLFAIVFVLFLTANFSRVYFPSFPNSFLDGLFSKERHPPTQRTDLNEVVKLDLYLESLGDKNDLIYVVSSSHILNPEILKNSYLYLKRQSNLENRVLLGSALDERDGFPIHFFEAKYVVVASPPQYHLSPKYQTVIKTLFDFMQSDISGSFYDKLPFDVKLAKGVEVRVYEKKAKLPNVIKTDLMSNFDRVFTPSL